MRPSTEDNGEHSCGVGESATDGRTWARLRRPFVRVIRDVSSWNLDIDGHLNRFIPSPPWRWLPYPIAHFLGYRRGERIPDIGNIAMVFWAAIGIFGAITLIELASRGIPGMEQNEILIVASFGAGAVLEFYAIESPLSQPRNIVLGQVIASTVGVGVSKLLAMSPRYHEIRWLGGGASCAAAVVLMALTETVHPPAGATALLAVVDNTTAKLGWTLVPIMLLGCVIMLAIALLVNNIQRRFPSYWWTPHSLASAGSSSSSDDSDSEDCGIGGDKRDPECKTITSENESLSPSGIVIRRGIVDVAPHLFLSYEEKSFLETLSNRV